MKTRRKKQYSCNVDYFATIDNEDIKNSCEICGDTYRLAKVGCKFPEYHGMTMCKKHYEQICKYGKITNPTKGQHKNGR